MPSYQRIALFIFFDAIERDLVARIRSTCAIDCEDILTDQEREKARARLRARDGDMGIDGSDHDLLHGLDLGDKYSVLLRHKNRMDKSASEYYLSKRTSFERAIPVRNATMHGRPLTTEEYSLGFSLAHEFLASPSYWPSLFSTYKEYGQDPDALLSLTITLFDDDPHGEVLNNLPIPDYDDTGFQPRRALESDLRKKILARHPVITVLGDGGDGKTALTLQTVYGLLESNDHNFDAIVWVSAKANRLTTSEVERIEGAITSSIGIFSDIADKFSKGEGEPIDRVRKLLLENKILLVIDNLETVLDDKIVDFASDVPGDSKVVFTSRVPLGSDLTVKVPAFSEEESLPYLRRLIEAYDIDVLRKEGDENLRKYLSRLAHKPLLVKWFAIGVSSGLDPARITANPEIALRFCMENVFERLGESSRSVLSAMAVVPQPMSANIIQHVTFLDPAAVEGGISELARFGLIEKAVSSSYERLYRLKPFVRSYVARVLRLNPKEADAFLARFRSAAGAYQEERGLNHRNRYDPKTFAVRSQSEALAARRLRHASALAIKGRFDEAEDIIAELKISNPEYFEVYRISAFISYKIGDVSAALTSYEAAFEHAIDQPQLHYFYGGLLMRSYGDYATAREQFDIALASDPRNTAVLREAARANFYLYDFEKAQRHIDEAWTAGFKTFHDEVVVNDLQAQLYVRETDHLYNTGDPRGAAEVVYKLNSFLNSVKPEVVDDIMVNHLRKAIRTIDALLRQPLDHDCELLKNTSSLIRDLSSEHHYDLSNQNGGPLATIYERTGAMKLAGRTERFGFLKDTLGVDTYCARNTVSASLWNDMCAGRKITYDIHTDGSGTTWAENVALL